MRTPMLVVLDEIEELSLQVTKATAGLRPRPGVVWAASFAAYAELSGQQGPFDVLIAGPSATKGDGLQQLRHLRSQTPETRLILALDHWRSTSLRDTVRTGALDALRLPISDDDLAEAVEQALQARRHRPPGPEDTRMAAKGHQGTVIAVVSATGGSGKTFLATNLAYQLQCRPGVETCLIDLDLQFGELATALRLRPQVTIHDLLAQEGDAEDLARRFEAHLVRHESGIRLLAAPDEPEDADAIDAGDVAQIIEAARSRFDFVIVDTPAALSEPVLVAVEQADQIFALATLDLPSVRNLGVMLSTLKKLKVPPERIKLMLNKVEPDVGIDVARVEQYFPQGFSSAIPYGREVNRSLNMGQPLLAYAPNGEVGKILAAALLRDVVVDNGDEAGDEAAVTRPRRSWLHRRSA
jgi:pilus assembly protein CpaE